MVRARAAHFLISRALNSTLDLSHHFSHHRGGTGWTSRLRHDGSVFDCLALPVAARNGLLRTHTVRSVVTTAIGLRADCDGPAAAATLLTGLVHPSSSVRRICAIEIRMGDHSHPREHQRRRPSGCARVGWRLMGQPPDSEARGHEVGLEKIGRWAPARVPELLVLCVDVELTTRLREVGELVGIPLRDHVVVRADGFISLAERNWR